MFVVFLIVLSVFYEGFLLTVFSFNIHLSPKTQVLYTMSYKLLYIRGTGVEKRMTQTYLTGWGLKMNPQRPIGKQYIGRITNKSKTWKYIEYIPFYASNNRFWIKVPREFAHELVGANRVKVVRTKEGKFKFHSAWYEEPEGMDTTLEEQLAMFESLSGGY